MLKEVLEARCIHECENYNQQEITSEGTETWTWCTECKELLYTKTHNITTDERKRWISDEVYKGLYTRAGRLQLLTEALLKLNPSIPIPEIWDVVVGD